MGRPPIFGALTRPPVLIGNKVKLRPKRLEDAAKDYEWRRDTDLRRLDAAPPLLVSFEEYLRGYAAELEYPGRGYRFAIESLDGKHIGNCSCFNIDEGRKDAELGIMIGDRSYWDRGYGVDAVLSLVEYILSQTGLQKIYLKTLNWNVRAQNCFRKCGFVPSGQLVHADHDFVLMEVRRQVKPQEGAE